VTLPDTGFAGPLNLAPPGILQAQQQGIFSPPSTGITHSPVQILGMLTGRSFQNYAFRIISFDTVHSAKAEECTMPVCIYIYR
jgi:hypothetical protein